MVSTAGATWLKRPTMAARVSFMEPMEESTTQAPLEVAAEESLLKGGKMRKMKMAKKKKWTANATRQTVPAACISTWTRRERAAAAVEAQVSAALAAAASALRGCIRPLAALRA